MPARQILWSAGGTTTPVAQITEAPAIRSIGATVTAATGPVGRLIARWRVGVNTIGVTSGVTAMAQRMRAFAATIAGTSGMISMAQRMRAFSATISGISGVVAIVRGVRAFAATISSVSAEIVAILIRHEPGYLLIDEVDILLIDGADKLLISEAVEEAITQAISAVISAISSPALVAQAIYNIGCVMSAVSSAIGIPALIKFFSSIFPATSAPVARTSSIRTFSATITSPPAAVVNEYSREANAALPGGSGSLTTVYSAAEITDVATDDGTYVSQAAADQYAIHEFKNDIVFDYATIVWNGQSTLACSSATVTLQIYNTNTSSWDVLDSDNTTAANTDFNLTAEISGLTNYKSGNTITCRVFQHS